MFCVFHSSLAEMENLSYSSVSNSRVLLPSGRSGSDRLFERVLPIVSIRRRWQRIVAFRLAAVLCLSGCSIPSGVYRYRRTGNSAGRCGLRVYLHVCRRLLCPLLWAIRRSVGALRNGRSNVFFPPLLLVAWIPCVGFIRRVDAGERRKTVRACCI